MSSFDKVVKLACKPKAAPPKAKYLEPIIAATWSDDGAVHDVCKALAPRFREPNAIVVFKALIVLHTMIRNGSTDNVLAYLSSSEILRLRNVSAGNWEGYAAPENLQKYAIYLDSRIRAYRDLKHDAIRVQAETNRDLRNSISIEESAQRSRNGRPSNTPGPIAPSRSKTIVGRKLRVMTVEKGLLRETKTVQRMIDTLVECKFYLDDLEDELTTTALRMLVKDLLILFQAGNEGVINVLEHYFEMSHFDATDALAIYRQFCKQTERVVEYLGVAKKLQNLLNVPIPNLKHAPVSLAGALQEYLDDANFEQNRIEYKAAKESADRNNKSATSAKNIRSETGDKDKPSVSVLDQPARPESNNNSSLAPSKPKAVVDFFNAIEEEQPTLFNPQTNSPSTAYFEAQAASNPFTARMQLGGQIQVQPTGFLPPQITAFQPSPTNPFGLQAQSTGHQPFSAFLPQQTAFTSPSQSTPLQSQPAGFLQPQAGGANPFRQSMLFAQSTGMPMFGTVGGMTGQINTSPPSNTLGNPNPFPVSTSSSSGSINSFPATSIHGFGNTGTSQQGAQTASTPFPTIGHEASVSTASAFTQNPFSMGTINVLPVRPTSTPITSSRAPSNTSPPTVQSVKTHQTGTKNPFGPIIVPAPPVPNQPTLFELSIGTGSNIQQLGQVQQSSKVSAFQMPQQTGLGNFDFNSGVLSAGPTDMSSIASSFAFNSARNPENATSPLPISSGLSTTNGLGALNAQNSVGGSATASSPTYVPSFTGMTQGSTTLPSNTLQPQMTGFAGLKPFKPTSSFGASLLESLPPIAGSPSTSTVSLSGNAAATSHITGLPSESSSALSSSSGLLTSASAVGAFAPIKSTVGVGLRPQMTGGAANPFRASTAIGNSSAQSVPPVPTLPSLNLGASAFSPNLFSSDPPTIHNGQQQNNTSLL